LQAFERGLFQQDQGVANIVRIGVRMSRQNLFDAGCQSNRPASSLRRTGCWMAWSHVDGGSLPSHKGIVTVVPSPIYGMPIIDADRARTVLVLKRSLAPGFAGIENNLFSKPNTRLLLGDAKASLQTLIA